MRKITPMMPVPIIAPAIVRNMSISVIGLCPCAVSLRKKSHRDSLGDLPPSIGLRQHRCDVDGRLPYVFRNMFWPALLCPMTHHIFPTDCSASPQSFDGHSSGCSPVSLAKVSRACNISSLKSRSSLLSHSRYVHISVVASKALIFLPWTEATASIACCKAKSSNSIFISFSFMGATRAPELQVVLRNRWVNRRCHWHHLLHVKWRQSSCSTARAMPRYRRRMSRAR